MITYEEALKKAKELKSNIDGCIEYDSAYMFKSEEDMFTIGGDGPVVILKKDGKAISQTKYYESYKAEELKEFAI